jgi:hypothetical protein
MSRLIKYEFNLTQEVVQRVSRRFIIVVSQYLPELVLRDMPTLGGRLLLPAEIFWASAE